MSNFRFLHAADIHLDSPLHGLSRYEGMPLDDVRRATRAAFDNLVTAALEQAVDFVVIAGDVFDGDWKDMSTGLYFARAMGRLAQAEVPVFLLNGNHDAASVLTRSLPLPASVRVFSSRKAETFTLDDLGVALHGRSFPTAQVTDDLAQAYPPPIANMFNIGVLHTALSGHPEHAPYAPCSVMELVAKGYDYWALGHVHEHQILHETPHVVFPGNLQGRHIRESGVKGAVLVEVEDRTVTSATHLPLDVIRWARVDIDCGGARDLDEVRSRAAAILTETYASGDGKPTVVRTSLCGTTSLHRSLQDMHGNLRDEIRALAAHVSPELWVEKVVVRTALPQEPDTAVLPALDDFAALLDEAQNSADLAGALAADLSAFLSSASAPAEGDDDLHAAARRADWGKLLDAGASALRARFLLGTE
jgi:exonuclease SbcD